VLQEDDGGTLEMEWLGVYGRVRFLAHLATLGARSCCMIRAPGADARVQRDAIVMTDLRAILPGVLAYADMFNKSACTRCLYSAPAARASLCQRRAAPRLASRSPPRLWPPVPELFNGTVLEKKNKVRAPSSQIYHEWLTLLQLRYLRVPKLNRPRALHAPPPPRVASPRRS
jgi:hypothetical protein